jgi:hypothetical protein
MFLFLWLFLLSLLPLSTLAFMTLGLAAHPCTYPSSMPPLYNQQKEFVFTSITQNQAVIYFMASDYMRVIARVRRFRRRSARRGLSTQVLLLAGSIYRDRLQWILLQILSHNLHIVQE